jgi:asparagine synthase (glutamine-hydrolysing)
VIAGFLNGHGDPLASMIAADVETLLPDDYLVKVDRASMAYGLEVRPPLLDHELLELAARIPSNLKIREGETKCIFKQAGGDLLPSGLRKRPKQGFETPVDSWLRGELKEMFQDLVLDRAGPIASLIDVPQARRALDLHCQGRARLGQTLWALMVLARWSDMFLSEAAEPLAPQTAMVYS